jgi:hypothetical protein
MFVKLGTKTNNFGELKDTWKNVKEIVLQWKMFMRKFHIHLNWMLIMFEA